MNQKKIKKQVDAKVAPGVDPDESFGKKATQADVDKEEYTTVTRLTYDEYDPSER